MWWKNLMLRVLNSTLFWLLTSTTCMSFRGSLWFLSMLLYTSNYKKMRKGEKYKLLYIMGKCWIERCRPQLLSFWSFPCLLSLCLCLDLFFVTLFRSLARSLSLVLLLSLSPSFLLVTLKRQAFIVEHTQSNSKRRRRRRSHFRLFSGWDVYLFWGFSVE